VKFLALVLKSDLKMLAKVILVLQVPGKKILHHKFINFSSSNYVLREVRLSFRSFSGTAREDKVFEQHLIVSDSISCRLPATVHTRLTNRKVLSWIRNVTGNGF